MRTRIVAATVVALVLVVLTGCTQQQTAFEGVAEAACEKKVGPAIVVWWRDQYGETPWKVVDTRATSAEQSSGDAGGASVSGESAVQREEHGGTAEAVEWSCSAHTAADDPSTVTASILEIAFP